MHFGLFDTEQTASNSQLHCRHVIEAGGAAGKW